MSSDHRLFVYGTLRRGYGMESVLHDCSWVGEAEVRGILYDLGPYPAMTAGGSGTVCGEIWSCPLETLHRLDTYEGVGEGLFVRGRIALEEGWCWAYLAGPRLEPSLGERNRIRSGQWQPPSGSHSA